MNRMSRDLVHYCRGCLSEISIDDPFCSIQWEDIRELFQKCTYLSVSLIILFEELNENDIIKRASKESATKT